MAPRPIESPRRTTRRYEPGRRQTSAARTGTPILAGARVPATAHGTHHLLSWFLAELRVAGWWRASPHLNEEGALRRVERGPDNGHNDFRRGGRYGRP